MATTNIGNGYFSNGYQPNNIGGERLQYDTRPNGTSVLIKDTPLRGSVNSAGQNMDNQHVFKDSKGRYYVWVGNGSNGGYYAQVSLTGNNQTHTTDFSNYTPDNAYVYQSTTTDKNGNVSVNKNTAGMYLDMTANNSKNKTTNTKPNNEVNTGGGVSAPDYTPIINAYQSQLADLRAELDELRRPKSADELAAQYDITDTLANKDYYTNMFTNYVNDYYNDINNEYLNRRAQLVGNNANYDNYLKEKYAKSYENALMGNTATNQGAVAANALSSSLNYDYNSSANDYSMLLGQQALQQQHQAALADVDNQAMQAYNRAMGYLMEAGANHYASDIQDYINGLNAASKIYAADKSAAGSAASAYATQYSGLANASNGYSSGGTALSNLYNYYLNSTGSKVQANNAVATLYDQKTNANN